ncbi:LysR family transcriptional regulator [Modestobacter sp. I12A-02628]|uniref:LysR family transcriptional regulator n=1 Tax=Goekera deserti TaxID=2497753 RepID=A0A7K3WGK9_9ACTN|nr:LysR family transcriptional regulator [Goekera deserti]MPQ99564.1 LysR family transcriptional regulator [Goekera deserti]NDI46424.1 LysR family transcriptional regulator [Goekera deserti]NEL54643.1 LysR family transcriptional regulator [Goekera deserti]
MIALDSLGALRAVGVLGSVVRAADELGYTPSAVSQRIKRLEREVGVPLLVASGRGVVLTAAGRALVEAAPEVFMALERCAEVARSVGQATPGGTVRVAAFSAAIRGLLAPAMPRLSAQYPDLVLHVEEADPVSGLHAVEADQADLALVHDDDLAPPPASFLTRRRVHTDGADVVVARTHPLARPGAPLQVGDLAAHPWVVSPVGTGSHTSFRRLFAAAPSGPRVRHVVDDVSAQLSLVAAGAVVAMIPRLARPPLGPELAVLTVPAAPSREVYAVWRRSADASTAVHAVVAAVGGAP